MPRLLPIVPTILLFLFKKEKKKNYRTWRRKSVFHHPLSPLLAENGFTTAAETFPLCCKEEMLYFPIDFFYTRFRTKSGKRKLPPSFLDPPRKSFDIPPLFGWKRSKTRGWYAGKSIDTLCKETQCRPFEFSSRRNERNENGKREEIVIAIA